MFKLRFIIFLTFFILLFNISNSSFLIAQDIEEETVFDDDSSSADLEDVSLGESNAEKNRSDIPIEEEDIEDEGEFSEPVSEEDSFVGNIESKDSENKDNVDAVVVEKSEVVTEEAEDIDPNDEMIPDKESLQKDILVDESKEKETDDSVVLIEESLDTVAILKEDDSLIKDKKIAKEIDLFLDFSRNIISQIDDIFFEILKQQDLVSDIYEEKVDKVIDDLLSEIGLEYGLLKGKERFKGLKDKVKDEFFLAWDDISNDADKIDQLEDQFLDLLDIFNDKKSFVSDLSINSKRIGVESFTSSEDILVLRKELSERLKQAEMTLDNVKSDLVEKANKLASKISDEIALVSKKIYLLKNGAVVASTDINLDKKEQIPSKFLNKTKNKFIKIANPLIEKISPIYLKLEGFVRKYFGQFARFMKDRFQIILQRLGFDSSDSENNKPLGQYTKEKIKVVKLKLNSLFYIAKSQSLVAYNFTKSESEKIYSKTGYFLKQFAKDVKRRSVELRKKHS